MKTAFKYFGPAVLVSAAGMVAADNARTTDHVSMSAAIQSALDRYPDLVLANAERDRERGAMLYEIELAGPDGKKRELHIDATNGQLVREHEEYDDDYDGMGAVQPFQTLMTNVKSSGGEDVREIELDRERGRWVYEVRAAGTGGVAQRMFFDAATGEVLEGDWD
jgi:uncharacterized membrane protein YkoI